jgi:hypothetical protein
MPSWTSWTKAARRSRKPDHDDSHDSQQARSALEPLEVRQLLSAAATSPRVTVKPQIVATPMASASSFTGYTPAQIKAAYGFNAISGDGTGQTIAIVDAFDDPNIQADLNSFSAKYGLPTTTITKVSQTGGSTKNVAASQDWAGEIALDVEWAHAIAPGATIDLVEANSDSIADLMAAVDVARRLSGVSVVSMSWGSNEFSGQNYFDKYFTTPRGHQGVTFVAASGDTGSAFGPSYPATSDYVLAVGGTTLNLTSTGAYASESGWLDGTGGVSSLSPEPSYQAAVQTTGAKSAPDVAYDANPNTGFAVLDSYGSGGWAVVGGTSAPQWAALVALADQARAAQGLGTLDGATGTLPTLYKLYNNASTYSSAFHDVTTGGSAPFYPAAAGYDASTGLGTPQASSVVAALTGATSTPLTTVGITTSRRRSSRTRSATAAVATTTTTMTTASTAPLTQPTPPKIVYSLRPNDAPAVFEALVNAPPPVAAAQPTVATASAGLISSGSAAAAQGTAQVTTSMDSGPVTSATVAAPGAISSVAAPAAESPTLVPISAADAKSYAAAMNDLASLLAGTSTHAPGVATITAATKEVVSSPAAWATTLGVLAADAVLVGYWYQQSEEDKARVARPATPFHLERLKSHGRHRDE